MSRHAMAMGRYDDSLAHAKDGLAMARRRRGAPWMARSRAALGDEAFNAAKDEGWSLTYDASIAELRRWLRDDAPGRLNENPASASGALQAMA